MLEARDAAEREDAWVGAVEAVAALHNEVGLTEPLDTGVRAFHSRPFRVLGAGRFADACLETVADPWLRSLPRVGAIDQLVDTTDALSVGHVSRAIASFYGSTT